MNKKATHNIELNFYYLHSNDAEKFALWAKREEEQKSKLKSIHARHAILSAVFTCESLINLVLADFYIPKSGSDSIERLSLYDKWIIAPLICTNNQRMTTFDKSADPFQSFAELIKIRNWLVHPKPDTYVDGALDEDSTITDIEAKTEYTWVDIIKGKIWPQTKIPVNPFELCSKHADKAICIAKAMEIKLKELMPNQITDDWLNRIKCKDKKTGSTKNITIDSLWGGYTPYEDR
ncbi:MAG: hypothetical protein KKH94_01715 [Candidatus Omnitrophica bacterium]|nr:hypothetical protein [Candidatus Omnitrophota bacterium]